MPESSLKRRYLIKLLASFVSGVVSILLIAIVPKALGPIFYGQFSYLQQFFTKVIGFLDAGSSIAFFTKLSARPKRKELITFYFLYGVFILAILVLFFYSIRGAGYMHLLLPNIDDRYIFLAIGFSFLTWATQVLIKVSDANALTVSVELIKIMHKISMLFLLLYLVKLSFFDLTVFFYFHYISLTSFIFFIVIFFYKRKILTGLLQVLKIDYKSISLEFISFCSPLLIYSVCGLCVGLFDIWLLQTQYGATQTGYYGLSYSIAAMCFIFTGAMTPVITREFSKSFEEGDIEEMGILFKRYVPMLYSLAAFFCVFISIQSENVLAIFTDEKFSDAFYVLVVIAFYPIHQTYGQLSGSIFYATGQTKLYRNIGFVSMTIGVVLTGVLVYILNLGAVGLALKMIIIQFIGVNIQLYYNAKFLKLNFRYFIRHQIYAIVFFLIPSLISAYLVSKIEGSIYSFLVAGSIYIILVLIQTMAFPQVFTFTRVELHRCFHQVGVKLKIIA